MVWMGFAPPDPEAEAKGLDRKGQPVEDVYCFISNYVLPRLHALGVTKEQTRQLMLDNPRRFFSNLPRQ